MSELLIRDLFAKQIDRHIEEVVKVDQTDEDIIREEIREYIPTEAIKKHFRAVLEKYREAPNKPNEDVGVWVSGFFGSGKSSFAKLLGLALANREIKGEQAGKLFGKRTGDATIEVLLAAIGEQIPTDAVIFDVSTDRGVKNPNQRITEIMYKAFLRQLGYAEDLDLAELEMSLEEEDRLTEFEKTFEELHKKPWDKAKRRVAFAMSQASHVMHVLVPDTYPSADSWGNLHKDQADVNPGQLAERCESLMARRCDGRNLVFVIDEVGQFVARDVQKMLDLQGVIQSLGRVGRGKHWVVVTSQEQLRDLVSGLDDKRVELARLRARFPVEIHLEPSDISEVTSKRVLSKNANAQKVLRELYEEYRGKLTAHTKLSADVTLPELTADGFINLYPLLPYQVDLIIDVVHGLRTQGGASKHVGGANRTIIKLAQQLLIHPDVAIGAKQTGALVTIDKIYDLVADNISSEVRQKIHQIESHVQVPMAQAVAKAICLLQYVKSIHRTAPNIAAALHPSVDGDSVLTPVKEALDALEKAGKIRKGEDGYRIPTPAEDDWEQQRQGIAPSQGEINRIHAETIVSLWQPQPSFNFLDTKVFKAGLLRNGKQEVKGDVEAHLQTAEAGKEFEDTSEELRKRSQAEQNSIFWAVELDDRIDLLTQEVHRSKEILARKERGAKTKEETSLVGEEKRRQRDNMSELRGLLRTAVIGGRVYFRGNDRSPTGSHSDLARAVREVLEHAVPAIYERFSEGAAKVTKKDLDALLKAGNLKGLTTVFLDLDLVHEKDGNIVFKTETGPLHEIVTRVKDRTDYGEQATGKWLEHEFGRDPFGWDFEVVRLLVASLLRSGKVDITVKGQTIDSATSLEAKNHLPNNTSFRGASVSIRKEDFDFAELAKASDAFRTVFGKDTTELEQSTIAKEIREALAQYEITLDDAKSTLSSLGLPGADILRQVLDQCRSIRNGNSQRAIQTFLESYKDIKEAVARAHEISTAMTETRVVDLGRARQALKNLWPFLDSETDLDEEIRSAAKSLDDRLERETFFRELAEIDQETKKLETEFESRLSQALDARYQAYSQALEDLRKFAGWGELSEAQQEDVSGPLQACARKERQGGESIPLLRSQVEGCPQRLKQAIAKAMEILEGNRLERLSIGEFFGGTIDNEEQLDAALAALRDKCVQLLARDKKVLIQ